MRTLVLILMIALLPLRVWAGDSMAVRMAVEPHAMTAQAAMPADCAMMADHAHEGDSHDAGATADCQACQLCPAVMVDSLGPARTAALPSLLVPAGLASYQSADPIPHHKPPIA